MPSERVKHRDVTYRVQLMPEKSCYDCMYSMVDDDGGFLFCLFSSGEQPKEVLGIGLCNEFVREDAKPYDGPPYYDNKNCDASSAPPK
jgi:hypothetical protein